MSKPISPPSIPISVWIGPDPIPSPNGCMCELCVGIRKAADRWGIDEGFHHYVLNKIDRENVQLPTGSLELQSLLDTLAVTYPKRFAS